MIVLDTPQVTEVTLDTIRLKYIELSFDLANARAILQYGSTAQDGTFTKTREDTVNIDPTVDGLSSALSDTRDAFESLLLVRPVKGFPVVTVAATQVTEATVGTLPVSKNPVQKVV